MKKDKNKIKIVKVPLKTKSRDIYPNFPPMPILYLELLENKDKIKPELRNKDYVPNSENDTNSQDKSENEDSKTEKLDAETIMYNDIVNDIKLSSSENKERFDYDYSKNNKYNFEKNELENTSINNDDNTDTFDDRYVPKKYSDEYRSSNDDKYYKKDKYDKRSKYDDYDKYDKRSKYDDYDKYDKKSKYDDYDKYDKRSKYDDYDKYDKKSKYDTEQFSDSDSNDNDYKKNNKYSKYDNILNDNKKDNDLVKNILSGRSESRETNEFVSSKKSEERSDTGNLSKNMDTEEGNSSGSENINKNIPPKLSEINKGNINFKANPLNYTKISRTDEEESNKKRELLFRFDILKRSYKNSNIPEYTEYTDLITLQKSYDDTVRRLSLDSNVENYKKYLIGGFMVVEFAFSTWLKFDMKGFTEQQLLSMNSYERLLIELGEKSYIETESSWPVEARLLSMIVINAVVFIISKMVFNKTGANLLNMMNSVSSFTNIGGGLNTNKFTKGANVQEENISPNSANAFASENIFSPKKKMKGPNIDINEFTFVSEEEAKKKKE